jgi:hypothetical protein
MASEDEYPPLLGQGFHYMGASDLKGLVIDKFPLSNRRPNLWKEFTDLLDEIGACGLVCDVWVDGSFLTEKIEPKDVDFIVEVSVHTLDSLTPEQEALIKKVQERGPGSMRNQRHLHGFVKVTAPEGHPFRAKAELQQHQWLRDFGFAYVSKEPKGIAIIGAAP